MRRVVVGVLVERLGDRHGEDATGVRVHHRLADVVLDRRVVGDAQADVDVALARRLALRDVDGAHRDAVPHRRGADEEPGVDGLVVGGGAVADRADDAVALDLDVGDLDRSRLVAAQAECVPGGRVRLRELAVDDEDREVVVAGEVRARRLHDVEVREAARRRPRRLLAHLVAAVGALGAGGDGVPEVRAGLGVRVGQGPDLAAVERADVAVDERVGGAQHDRLHGAHVHDVAHGRRRAAVARDRLAGHGERHVVLAEAAVLLGHGQAEEAVFTEQFEVAPRVGQRVVGDLRVLAHLLLAQLDQEIAQLELALRQKPVGVPIRPQPEVGLIAPALLAHADLQGLARGRTLDK